MRDCHKETPPQQPISKSLKSLQRSSPRCRLNGQSENRLKIKSKALSTRNDSISNRTKKQSFRTCKWRNYSSMASHSSLMTARPKTPLTQTASSLSSKASNLSRIMDPTSSIARSRAYHFNGLRLAQTLPYSGRQKAKTSAQARTAPFKAARSPSAFWPSGRRNRPSIFSSSSHLILRSTSSKP